jgi:putative membrane protein
VEIVINYALHLVTAGLLLYVFFLVYCWATPFDEIGLIRQGNGAAALSLGGALIGFSLTVASGIVHTDSLVQFFAWAVGAALVQLAAYVLVTRLLHMSKDQIEGGNIAFGGLLAAISIAVGAINAACLS